MRMTIPAIITDGTVLVSFVTNQSHLGRVKLSKELPLADWPVGMAEGHFLDKLLTREGPSYFGQDHS